MQRTTNAQQILTLCFPLMQSLGESSSVVERCLAKAKAEGSTPFFRFSKVIRLWEAVLQNRGPFGALPCKNAFLQGNAPNGPLFCNTASHLVDQVLRFLLVFLSTKKN